MRTFVSLAASVLLITSAAAAQTGNGATQTVVFAAVGPELTQYDVDVDSATLVPRGSVTLPARVQEATQHRGRPYLYVGWSTIEGPADAPANQGIERRHGLTAVRIDPSGTSLQLHGQSVPLRARPIHVTTDIDGKHVLVAYNDPSGVSVHRLAPDGTIGAEVPPAEELDGGIYGHYIGVLPSNQGVVLATRGNRATLTTPEDPGALKVYSYRDGVLANRASIAPNGGRGFQPRHLDVHPSRPWVFLTIEQQNQLEVYAIDGDTLGASALFSADTLAEPPNLRPGQSASTVRVHPNGRFVYVGNRARATTEFQRRSVFAGGENTIAVFAINETSGEPTLIQTVDTRGSTPRTFALDGTGRLLIVGNQRPFAVRDGDTVRDVPASLSVFRVGADGRLEFAHKYDVATDTDAGWSLFWMGAALLD